MHRGRPLVKGRPATQMLSPALSLLDTNTSSSLAFLVFLDPELSLSVLIFFDSVRLDGWMLN